MAGIGEGRAMSRPCPRPLIIEPKIGSPGCSTRSTQNRGLRRTRSSAAAGGTRDKFDADHRDRSNSAVKGGHLQLCCASRKVGPRRRGCRWQGAEASPLAPAREISPIGAVSPLGSGSAARAARSERSTGRAGNASAMPATPHYRTLKTPKNRAREPLSRHPACPR